MTVSSLRRVLAFTAIVSIWLLPATFQPLAAAAASTGTLFAITSSNQALVSVDLTTGSFTQLADLNTPNQPQSTSLASDPRGHRLFAIRTSVIGFDPTFGFPIFSQELLTVDSRTGAQLYSPAPTFSSIAPQALVFDTSSGTLFGFTGLDIVKVDPATATLTTVASVATSFGPFIYSLGIDSATSTLYLSQEGPDANGNNTTNLRTVNDQSGAASTPVVLDQPVRQIGIDSGHLYGITECCPANLVGINSTTGATSFVQAVGGSSTVVQFGTAADPATHNVFINVSTTDPNTFAQVNQLLVVNDQTGAFSTLALADGMPSLGLAFEAPVVTTAQSIKADVVAAESSGAISNAGVANSLVSELSAAAGARGRGQCATAANLYQAFVNELQAQSGKTVAPATAAQLTTEAQFLISNCP